MQVRKTSLKRTKNTFVGTFTLVDGVRSCNFLIFGQNAYEKMLLRVVFF